MVTNDLVMKIFNDKFFPELKKYVEGNSIYEPLVVKTKPTVSKKFPIIPVKLLPTQNTYGNLSYTQERFSFGIEIDINAQDKTVNNEKISKQVICEEIANWIIKYFKENYRVTTYIDSNATSTDSTVHRSLIRISGVLDTRYGMDKLVVYPR